MLKIVGTDGEGTEVDAAQGMKAEGEAFEALMREFDERMKVLRTVVEAGAGQGLDEEGGDIPGAGTEKEA
jgi:hypothetical protein